MQRAHIVRSAVRYRHPTPRHLTELELRSARWRTVDFSVQEHRQMLLSIRIIPIELTAYEIVRPVRFILEIKRCQTW